MPLPLIPLIGAAFAGATGLYVGNQVGKAQSSYDNVAGTASKTFSTVNLVLMLGIAYVGYRFVRGLR